MGICIDCGNKTTATCIRCRSCNLKMPRTKEMKEKVSNALRGFKRTEEEIKKAKSTQKDNRNKLIKAGIIIPKNENCIDCGVSISKDSTRCFNCYLKIPRILTEETKLKISKTNKGQKRTAETIKNISISKKGTVSWNSGKPYLKIRGENHHNWKGGKSGERRKEMGRIEYVEWRRQIFRRDDYTCQNCKKRGVELHADHIKPWATYPELRYDINNGRALCVPCHRKTDTYGGRIVAKTAVSTNVINEGDAVNDRGECEFIGLSVSGTGTIFISGQYVIK